MDDVVVVDDMDAMPIVTPAGPGMGYDEGATQKRLDAIIVEVNAFRRRRTFGSTTLADLLDSVGLGIPDTTEALLQAAKALHGARRGLSGIVMNYGRGTPVAHTFIQTLADFGSPVIDLARSLGEL